MKKILFSKQADCDLDILPLWYWWYTNIFKVDQIIIQASGVKGSTTIDGVREFWKDKDVIYTEKFYDVWFAPRVWVDQKAFVLPLLPKEDYFVLSVDSDEFFEPPTQEAIDAHKSIGAFSFAQARMWSKGLLKLDTIQDAKIYSMVKQGLLNTAAVRRGAFINSFTNKNITTVGLVRNIETSGLHFFHIHFRGLDWFKSKFGQMKYAEHGRGASFHWKRYTALLQEENEISLEDKYQNLLNSAIDTSEPQTELVRKFKKYFDSEK